MAEYIDRDALIDNLQKFASDEYSAAVNNIIMSIPKADVTSVVHGRWITRSDKGIISMTHPYMCSRCGRVEMDKEPYCNCGAKMDEGVNE